jgi:hypothetical protein
MADLVDGRVTYAQRTKAILYEVLSKKLPMQERIIKQNLKQDLEQLITNILEFISTNAIDNINHGAKFHNARNIPEGIVVSIISKIMFCVLDNMLSSVLYRLERRVREEKLSILVGCISERIFKRIIQRQIRLRDLTEDMLSRLIDYEYIRELVKSGDVKGLVSFVNKDLRRKETISAWSDRTNNTLYNYTADIKMLDTLFGYDVPLDVLVFTNQGDMPVYYTSKTYDVFKWFKIKMVLTQEDVYNFAKRILYKKKKHIFVKMLEDGFVPKKDLLFDIWSNSELIIPIYSSIADRLRMHLEKLENAKENKENIVEEKKDADELNLKDVLEQTMLDRIRLYLIRNNWFTNEYSREKLILTVIYLLDQGLDMNKPVEFYIGFYHTDAQSGSVNEILDDIKINQPYVDISWITEAQNRFSEKKLNKDFITEQIGDMTYGDTKMGLPELANMIVNMNFF